MGRAIEGTAAALALAVEQDWLEIELPPTVEPSAAGFGS
jgi:hypothetical protein